MDKVYLLRAGYDYESSDFTKLFRWASCSVRLVEVED